MDNNKLGTKPHYQMLDGLRGLAAVIVVSFTWPSRLQAAGSRMWSTTAIWP